MAKTYVKNAAAMLAISALAFSTMGIASAESGYTHTRTLKVGSRGLAVESLQEAINACWDLGLVTDGIFGKGVKKAVQTVQKELGVTPDGIVGKTTGAGIADCDPMDSEDNTTDTTTDTTTTSTTLTGPEGNLTSVNKLALYNNTKVNEGNTDVKVYALEMTAKDGDQKIDGFNVAFKNTGSGSVRFTRVASEISIWLDGKEIGRKSASSYSDDANDVYSYRFSGMNGIVKKDAKAQLIVAVTPVSTFDSTDVSADAWKVEAGTVYGTNSNFISAMSANGRFRDFGSDTTESTIDFQKATGDATFKVTTSSTNPLAQTVQVSKTADTTDKLLLAFDVKAENADMVIQRLPITMTSSGTLTSIVKTVKLYANGNLIASEVPAANVLFGNSTKLGYKLAKNSSVKFEIKADLNSTGASYTNYANGATLAASYATATNYVEIDNANRDVVTTYTGSATGELQTLRTTGMQVTMMPSTTEATANQTGEILTRTIKIPVTVKAFDDTVYLSQVAENALTPTTTQAIAFTFEDAAGAVKTITNSVTLTSTDATVEGSAYRVDAGSTKTFNLTVVLTGTTGNAQKQYRVQLNKINAYSNAALSTGQTLQDATPVNSFETSYYTLNLN